MKNLFFLIIFYFLTTSFSFGTNSEFFIGGKDLFEKKKYEKSKIYFERDIVFNPKSAKSYLYLAKIYQKDENDFSEEINLNSVLLLEPKNDEAIYMLIMLKIRQSDYDKAKELMEKFTIVCNSFCSKKREIEEKFNKLIPENERQ